MENHMQSCIFLGEVQFFLGRDLTVLVTLIDKKHNNYIENTILYMCTTCTSSNCKKTLPTLPSSAQRRVQVTFWQAGHKGMYDILITVYELSPGNQVSSSIYSFAILCFCYDPVQGLLNAYVHYICTSKQTLAVTQIYSLLVCYMFWAAKPFEQDTRG